MAKSEVLGRRTVRLASAASSPHKRGEAPRGACEARKGRAAQVESVDVEALYGARGDPGAEPSPPLLIGGVPGEHWESMGRKGLIFRPGVCSDALAAVFTV